MGIVAGRRLGIGSGPANHLELDRAGYKLTSDHHPPANPVLIYPHMLLAVTLN